MQVKPFALALAFLPLANSQTVSVVQPDATDLQLVGAQSPGFQDALAAVLSPQISSQLFAYLPFTVVLKNTSRQALAGYRFWWAINPAPDQRTGGRGDGLLFITDTSGYLQPGASAVAMPQFILTHDPGTDLLEEMQQQQSSILSGLQRARVIGISLDSAIFASGQFVGPDVGGTSHKTRHPSAAGGRWTQAYNRN